MHASRYGKESHSPRADERNERMVDSPDANDPADSSETTKGLSVKGNDVISRR